MFRNSDGKLYTVSLPDAGTGERLAMAVVSHIHGQDEVLSILAQAGGSAQVFRPLPVQMFPARIGADQAVNLFAFIQDEVVNDPVAPNWNYYRNVKRQFESAVPVAGNNNDNMFTASWWNPEISVYCA